jgi:hypothetical protein
MPFMNRPRISPTCAPLLMPDCQAAVIWYVPSGCLLPKACWNSGMA